MFLNGDLVWVVFVWQILFGVCVVISMWQGLGGFFVFYDCFNLGVCSGDEVLVVGVNCVVLQVVLGLLCMLQWLEQVYGIDVVVVQCVVVNELWVDVVIICECGQLLVIFIVDCLLVLLCSDDGGVIGVVYVGWWGLVVGVFECMVVVMVIDVVQLQVWLGLCIGFVSYEVGEEVCVVFVDGDVGVVVCFVLICLGYWCCDLVVLVW